jgi:hypothetical protein
MPTCVGHDETAWPEGSVERGQRGQWEIRPAAKSDWNRLYLHSPAVLIAL